MVRAVKAEPKAGTVSQGQAGGEAPGMYRRRGRWVVAAAAGLVAVGAVVAWLGGAFHSPGPSHAGAGAAEFGTSTATVTRRSLASTTPVSATLGFAGSYTVIGKGSGTITWLPSQGSVIRQGHVLYKVDNGTPVVLLRGSVPGWRALEVGKRGADVAQLNHDLVGLGYASRAKVRALGWDYFSSKTKTGVKKLQSALGEGSPSGKLPLGSVVFEPSALRVTTVPAQLGGPVPGTVLSGTSTVPAVTIGLDASMQSEVKRGDKVSVTLPDGSVTPGVISHVGTVATSPSSTGSSGGSGGGSPTVPVTVTLTHPRAAGGLDQAPVTVDITTASVKNALVVPVAALLAQAGEGYAVEVVSAGGRHHLVPVSVGLADDAAGLVQVTGDLAPGQRVVVPGS